MRRNRLKERIEKRRNLKRISISTSNSEKNNLFDNFSDLEESDDNTIAQKDALDCVNQVINGYDDNAYKLNPIYDFDHAAMALSTLKEIIQGTRRNYNTEVNLLKKIKANDIDPSLDFRFLTRKPNDDIYLLPIKTRLKWQAGEFPFFKIEVRYYNQKSISFKNNRHIERAIKCFVEQDLVKNQYIPLAYPDDDWPCKGTLYISNLRLFYKQNKENRFSITFDKIISYTFHENALIVDYLHDNFKKTDVFYIDSEQARLLETMIRITL